MTPTHKPEDGDRAPIGNGGVGLERFNVSEHFDPFDDASYGVMEASEGGAWVKFIDATALLAEKAQRIERLEALLKVFGRELERAQRLYEYMNGEPDPTKEQRLRLIDSTLSQPHPHGG